MIGVEIHWDSPREAGARHTEVIQTLLNEINHLIFTALRLDKLWTFFIQFEQTVAILGKTEEIGLLFRPFDLAPAVRAFAVLELRFRPEGLAGRTIPSFIFAFIDGAFLIQSAEYFLYSAHMIRICRTDKAVVADIQKLPKALEPCNNFVDIFLRGYPRFRRFEFDLLAVLIRARQKHHVISL